VDFETENKMLWVDRNKSLKKPNEKLYIFFFKLKVCQSLQTNLPIFIISDLHLKKSTCTCACRLYLYYVIHFSGKRVIFHAHKLYMKYNRIFALPLCLVIAYRYSGELCVSTTYLYNCKHTHIHTHSLVMRR